MTTHQFEDLVAAYALDAVDGEERTMLERAIAADAGLARELAEYHEMLAVLAESVESAPSTPSHSVWENISGEIAGAREVPAAPTFLRLQERRRRRRFTGRFMSFVAAGALVVAVVLGVRLATDPDAGDLVAAAEALIAAEGSQVVTLTADDGITVEVVIGVDGVGYVYDDNLPGLGSERTYQLWAINDNGVISAGILGADPEVAPFQVSGQLTGLAVTEEVAGGVVSSENPALAVWLADA